MSKQEQTLVLDLRRSLFSARIAAYNAEWLKEGCPLFSGLKSDVNNLLNCIKRIEASICHKLPHEHLDEIRCELNDERLHDINLLLDAIADVGNVAEIAELINSNKVKK